MELVFSNSAGGDKIGIAMLMIAPSLVADKSCWIEYVPEQSEVRMKDGSGNAKAGASVSISNSQCTIDAARVKHKVDGNSLRLSVPVRLTTAVVGTQNIYALASTATEHSGWVPVGTWTPASK